MPAKQTIAIAKKAVGYLSTLRVFAKIPVTGLPITRCKTKQVQSIIKSAIAGATHPIRMATVNLDFLRLASKMAICIKPCANSIIASLMAGPCCSLPNSRATPCPSA